MKWYLLFSLFVLVQLINPKVARAIDQESIMALEREGHLVKLGELTGAGGKMPLSELKGLIHPEGVIFKAEIQKLILTNPNIQSAKIADIATVLVGNRVINAREFEGFFIQK